MGLTTGAPTWTGTVRMLFLVAMAVFLVTIAIGILNGLDVVEFTHDQILTHVHSGTLGWVTLTIVAAAAWFARGIDRRLALALAVLIPVYVALFYLAWPPGRAIAGAALLVAIVVLLAWAWRVQRVDRSLPSLALALGLTTFTYGAVIGVMRQVQLADGPALPGDVVGAHASAMVFSYLVLSAMGVLEWRLLGTRDVPRSGLVQVVALFAGGVIISGTLLFLPVEALQPAGGLYLLVELIAVSLFAVRVLPTALRQAASGTTSTHLGLAALFVVIAMLLFLYVIFRVIADPSKAVTDPDIIGVLTASDHAAFIGVITNLMLGLMLALTRDQEARTAVPDRVALWVMNVGLVVFLVGLVAGDATLKRIGSPVMGVAILVALGLAAWRLRASSLAGAEET